MCATCEPVETRALKASGLSVWTIVEKVNSICIVKKVNSVCVQATSSAKFVSCLVFDITCVSALIGISLVAMVTRAKPLKRKTVGILPQRSRESPDLTCVTLPPTPPSTSSDSTESEDSDLGAVPKTSRREGRKVLPPIPDSETEAEMSASVISKQNVMSGGGGNSNGQIKLEYILMNEYNMLHKHKLPGVYVIPSALSPLIWNGVIFIRQGLYQGAVFRFNLNIPENYPNGDCPRVFFEHLVFHPVIDPKFGELDVKREFKKWRRNSNFLWQVLMYVRRIFFKIDPKCPSNPEAAELYEQNMEEFRKRIEDSVQSSKDVLYNPIESNDAHMIRFTPWDSGIHEEARSDMLTRKVKSSANSKSGTS